MAYDTFTLTGTHLMLSSLEGRQGRVRVTCSVPAITDSVGNIVFSRYADSILNAEGYFDLVLPTWGPDLTPEEWSYTISFFLDGGDLASITFNPPAADTTIDVADLIPTDPVVLAGDAVSTSTFTAAIAELEAASGESIVWCSQETLVDGMGPIVQLPEIAGRVYELTQIEGVVQSMPGGADLTATLYLDGDATDVVITLPSPTSLTLPEELGASPVLAWNIETTGVPVGPFVVYARLRTVSD